MAPGATVPCSCPQAFSRAMEEGVEGKERVRSGLALPVLTFIATIVVFSGVPFLPGTGAEGVKSVSPACTASGSATTCTCSDAAAAASESKQSATLSKDTNILTVKCGGELQHAPAQENSTMVCSAEPGDLKQCNIEIVKLLAGTPNDVKWEACDAQERNGKPSCQTLTIPQDNLPFADQNFAVGCTGKDSTNKVCKVDVTLKAIASATNGQTVTCAYGAGSNESRQAVTLNPSKNSFTLVCGEKGTVLPTNYDTKFCSSDPAGTSTTCDGDYQSILPGFENGWWKKDDPTANSFTLSIPVEKFPTEQASMVVACQQTKTKSGSGSPAEGAATSSVCRVDVTIEASAFAAAAGGMKGVFASLAGTALLVMVSQA